MRVILLAAPALLLAGCSTVQSDGHSAPMNPDANVPSVTFSSAFENYRPFVDQELQDWRKANEEVGAAGGHAGHRPGQGPGRHTSKPMPGEPQSSGAHGDPK